MTAILAPSSGPRVLVVEDSPDHRLLMERRLSNAGFATIGVASGEEAVPLLGDVDVVVVDQGLPRMSGLDLLDIVLGLEDAPAAIVVTAGNSTELVVEAMRRGAVDFVTKDSQYLDTVPAVVTRAHRQRDVTRRNQELQRLALLVHQAAGTDEVMREITSGAQRLLRASACGLAVGTSEGTWRLEASSGPDDALAETVGGGTSRHTWRSPTRLAVEVPMGKDQRPAVLLVDRPETAAFTEDEHALASAFAALAATALQRARRSEMEHALVDELSRTLQVRQNILASVSHELRTPLTAIGGFAEFLLERRDSLTDDDVEAHLQRILRNADRLRRLVNELLESSAVASGEGTPAHVIAVGLAEAASDVATTTAGTVGRHDLQLDIPSDLTVLADPELLRRVLSNLVVNAAKYSPETSPITVAARQEGDRARIEVVDEGIGIDARDLTDVFQPFYRTQHASQQAVPGTGLGLSLVKSYVDAMGGEVGVRSTPGEGSTFWFTLALAGAG